MNRILRPSFTADTIVDALSRRNGKTRTRFTPFLALISLAIPLWLSVCAQVAFAQGGIKQEDLYIIFLHEQAWHANHADPNAKSHANQLHISPGELPLVSSAAAQFVVQENALRQEALAYHRSMQTSGAVPDPSVVKTFTARRQALAVAAMASIQGGISAASFSGVQQYLVDLNKSVKTAPLGR